MELVQKTLFGLICASLFFLVITLYFASTQSDSSSSTENIFGFSQALDAPSDQPQLLRYPARDKSLLAYRFYDSSADKILIFVHGSSYHGGAYHDLAQAISASGAAKVYLPNLRGHYLSGIRRGDVNYIGQLEDDVADLILFARQQGHQGEITVGGHSSGGGFAIRFAGGEHRDLVSRFLLLAPIIPLAPVVRGGNAGGWADLNSSRLYALLAMNAVGLTGLNGLDIIHFNKPEKFWDGSETLSYSYRLNTSYHPRYNYQADIEAMANNFLVLIGENDEAIDASKLGTLFNANVTVLSDVNHFGVFTNPAAHSAIIEWIR